MGETAQDVEKQVDLIGVVPEKTWTYTNEKTHSIPSGSCLQHELWVGGGGGQQISPR